MNSTNKRRQHTRWTEERKQQLAEAYARGGNREACRVCQNARRARLRRPQRHSRLRGAISQSAS